MSVGDTVYYRGDPVAIVRKASPYVFGYLAKKLYVIVRVSKEIAAAWGREDRTKRNVRVYAIAVDELSTSRKRLK